tara:strand:+ start:829 stop:1044 length:216 start_codon:yes stop_codon:yes gene_type:complete
MLITKMDIKYINKAIDYVENVQGYTAVLIKEKKFCETYVIDAMYGATDEWYQLEVNVKIGDKPSIVNSKKM